METWTCSYSPFEEKVLIKNNYTLEEYWITKKELFDTLFLLSKKRGLKKLYFEGSYIDLSKIIYIYNNKYPNSDISFTMV